MKRWRYKIGQWLARRRYVRSAIEENADLAVFKKPPTVGIVAGMFFISISFLIAWPSITVLGWLAIEYRQPLILVIGGPVFYGMSHVVFLLGMYLVGGVKYPNILLRWVTRVGVQKLLAGGPERGA